MKKMCLTVFSLCLVPAFAQDAAWHHMNQAAQNALQQNIYHHHILPAEQAAAAQRAAQGSAVPSGTAGGQIRTTGHYYYNAAGYVSFAIGAEPHREVRHPDGYRLIHSRSYSDGTNYFRGEPDHARVRDQALRRCGDSNKSACQVIAEAGNTCVAVASGYAHPLGDDVDRYGVSGELYRRYYVAYLTPQERGNPQFSPDDIQVNQWREMLAARAHQMCTADRVHPLHECEELKSVWSMCGIDEVARGSTGVYL